MNLELYFAAQCISQIWYDGFKEEKPVSNRHAIYCRAIGIVMFDRVLLGRVKVTS